MRWINTFPFSIYFAATQKAIPASLFLHSSDCIHSSIAIVQYKSTTPHTSVHPFRLCLHHIDGIFRVQQWIPGQYGTDLCTKDCSQP